VNSRERTGELDRFGCRQPLPSKLSDDWVMTAHPTCSGRRMLCAADYLDSRCCQLHIYIHNVFDSATAAEWAASRNTNAPSLPGKPVGRNKQKLPCMH